ncbi:hypothetical protein PN36_29130 [Candidatus Thiomargarita nelsonii]|uniref:Uncharacterized protein n=1 Tax=Candidatus Thiomargarita nelsonii TaxID=1003181 RepID=A0A0A6PAW8_9GAMM|nr:hypothetical protein PN36_29130 [Candidatus Thiomargarita nelsonii]
MSEPKLPIGKTIPPDVLESSFFKVQDKPYGNPELAYSLLVPKDWNVDSSLKAKTNQLGRERLKPLAIFAAPDGSHSFIQLHAIGLPREISAAHWLRHYAATTDRTIVELEELSVLFADSLMTFKIEDHTFVGRAAVRIDGDRLFMVFGFAIEAAYQALAETFGLAISSFKLLSPSSRTSIEPHRRHNLADIVQFDCPASWKHKVPENPPIGKQAIDFYHFDDNNAFQGLIRVKAVSKTVVNQSEEVIKNTVEEYADSNLILRDKLHSSPVGSYSARFSNGFLIIYGCTIEGNEENQQELWICAFEDEKHYIVTSLLTPSRRQIFYTWAFNKRAYEIVLESIQ